MGKLSRMDGKVTTFFITSENTELINEIISFFGSASKASPNTGINKMLTINFAIDKTLKQLRNELTEHEINTNRYRLNKLDKMEEMFKYGSEIKRITKKSKAEIAIADEE